MSKRSIIKKKKTNTNGTLLLFLSFTFSLRYSSHFSCDQTELKSIRGLAHVVENQHLQCALRLRLDAPSGVMGNLGHQACNSVLELGGPSARRGWLYVMPLILGFGFFGICRSAKLSELFANRSRRTGSMLLITHLCSAIELLD